MFEKEAKEYSRDFDWTNDDVVIDYSERGFQKGAEFGYNKANEWHYVKDGDLPKDEEWKWCVSSRGYSYVAKYEELFVSWTNQENKEVMCPYAWKDIVLPKLINDKVEE